MLKLFKHHESVKETKREVMTKDVAFSGEKKGNEKQASSGMRSDFFFFIYIKSC